jgi:hypothetical protein
MPLCRDIICARGGLVQMRMAIAAGLLAVAAPAVGQAPSLDQAMLFNALRDKTKACYSVTISRLDDRRSDARTIALAVREACNAFELDEITRSVEVGEDIARRILAQLDSETSARVIVMVLESRAKVR